MFRRNRNRVRMVMAVHVTGHDADGRKFELLTHTLDISLSGTRVGGMSLIPLKCGDEVEVQRKYRKGKFRVTWVGQPDSTRTGQLGLELISAPPDFWGLDLPTEGEKPISITLHPPQPSTAAF
jgi:hypothetical protein